MITTQDAYGQTLLHWAVFDEDLENTKNIIQEMDIDQICIANRENDYTALHIAAQNGSLKMINLLVEKGKHQLTSKVDRYGQTALHWCASNPNYYLCAEAIVNNMQLESLLVQNYSNNYSVLHLAAQVGNNLLIKLLLSKTGEALVGQTDRYNHTALHWTVANANEEASAMLVRYMTRTEIDKVSLTGHTALDLAIKNDHPKIINLLTEIANN